MLKLSSLKSLPWCAKLLLMKDINNNAVRGYNATNAILRNFRQKKDDDTHVLNDSHMITNLETRYKLLREK